MREPRVLEALSRADRQLGRLDILKQPVLYLSDDLERNREEYYERLTRVREKVWVNARMVAQAAGVSQPTAYKLIERFVHAGLLREITGPRRDRLFLFDPYLKPYLRT